MNGAELKARREALDYTQKGMADALGVSLDTYQNWEQGRRSMDAVEGLVDRALQRMERRPLCPVRQYYGRTYLVLQEPALIDRPQLVPVVDLTERAYTPIPHRIPDSLHADMGEGAYASVQLAPGAANTICRIEELVVRVMSATTWETNELIEQMTQ